ncbi:PQQ-dependent sugar dehydrogenase [Roseicitreum antarcticum]|uniref:Glucose/Sorbosone dehydrogenase domain-containing protein n=1 Tax=Roseicitreum antarcticum TaxID=564137 RepID=A0A1H2WHR9_9RHOB|nr:PQQ-dependent sugar dehydrogenase [Roseicitreum antarcticum]SDW79569.1 hypothetical protein SAMN04488238_103374 [Roseicitreum antarcticum]
MQKGFIAAFLGALVTTGAAAQSYTVNTVVPALNQPWGMAFIPQSDQLLVTERGGSLQMIDVAAGSAREVSGLPRISTQGQGGLLDVALHPEFADNALVYLTWSGAGDGGTATHLGRARLNADAAALENLELLYIATPFLNSGAHFGSRIVFDDQNRVYFTTGDRGSKAFGPDHFSQDLGVNHGKVLRLNDDGTIPADNPFVGTDGALPAIFSYGHRNPQGMALHPETGAIWANEHGENNGDEINILQEGGNFGWPIASYAVTYSGGQRFAPAPPQVPGTVPPVYWWEADHPEGFPPSGLAFYEGDAFPEWRGHAFMGNLRHQYLGVFSVDGAQVSQTGRLLESEGWRIRDVAIGPQDGFVYALADGRGAPLLRLEPAQ